MESWIRLHWSDSTHTPKLFSLTTVLVCSCTHRVEIGEKSRLEFDHRTTRPMTCKYIDEPKSSSLSTDSAIDTKATARCKRVNFKDLTVIPPVESWIGHQLKGQVIPPAERKYLIDDDPAYPKGLYVPKEGNSSKSRILAPKHLQ